MNSIGKIIGLIIISVQIISYLITVFANPGFPKKLNETEINSIEKGKGMQYCKRCGFVIKPGEGTFHCFECDVCIVGKKCYLSLIVSFRFLLVLFMIIFLGYDHHCPWASKCIGKNNIVPFYFFISFTTFLFGYLILSVSLVDT